MSANYGGGLKGGKVRYDQSVLFIPDESEKPALEEDPRFFVPAYYGPNGWLGLILEDTTDWDEVAELLDASYPAGRAEAVPGQARRLTLRGALRRLRAPQGAERRACPSTPIPSGRGRNNGVGGHRAVGTRGRPA